jgi:hypothetical protein
MLQIFPIALQLNIFVISKNVCLRTIQGTHWTNNVTFCEVDDSKENNDTHNACIEINSSYYLCKLISYQDTGIRREILILKTLARIILRSNIPFALSLQSEASIR